MPNELVLIAAFPIRPNFFPLQAPGAYLIGRLPECQIRVRHHRISREHARLEVTEAGVTVVDLDSSNGTFVDGQPITQAELKVGQRLQLADSVFILATPEPPSGVADDLPDDGMAQEETDVPADLQDDEGSACSAWLSPIRQAVLGYLLAGYDEKQTAEKMHLAPSTIHKHIGAIYRFFDVHKRGELMALFLGSQSPARNEENGDGQGKTIEVKLRIPPKANGKGP